MNDPKFREEFLAAQKVSQENVKFFMQYAEYQRKHQYTNPSNLAYVSCSLKKQLHNMLEDWGYKFYKSEDLKNSNDLNKKVRLSRETNQVEAYQMAISTSRIKNLIAFTDIGDYVTPFIG